MVIGIDRGRYLTRLDGRDVTAVKARELAHRGVVVGDEAFLVGDTSGARDALARIVRVGRRRTELRRATDEGRGRERVIVANADQMVIVAALAEPDPRPGMIDRQLVAARDAGLGAVLALTKSDLSADRRLRDVYEPLGVAVAVVGRVAGPSGDARLSGLDRLAGLLAGRVSVLVGHSGVGKSTLINGLVPGAARATGEVNLVTGKGRHTSSSALALEFEGGWVIDTPGVRSFGLAHIAPERVLAGFPDLAEVAGDCPRGCPHGPHSRGCALRQWAVNAPDRELRLESYLRIVAGSGSNSARGSKIG
jgi:ribosome biogenesis GTPase